MLTGCLVCVLVLRSCRARGMLACPLALRLLPQSLIAIVDCSFRGAFVACSQRDVRSLCDQRPDLKDRRLCLFDLAIAFVVLLRRLANATGLYLSLCKHDAHQLWVHLLQAYVCFFRHAVAVLVPCILRALQLIFEPAQRLHRVAHL